MPELWYVAAVLVIVFVITLALRAVPFAVLKPLRESKFVMTMATWMPVGILAILAAATFHTTTGIDPGHVLKALVAVVITAVVHLSCGKRTLLSVGTGTLSYIALINLLQ